MYVRALRGPDIFLMPGGHWEQRWWSRVVCSHHQSPCDMVRKTLTASGISLGRDRECWNIYPTSRIFRELPKRLVSVSSVLECWWEMNDLDVYGLLRTKKKKKSVGWYDATAENLPYSRKTWEAAREDIILNKKPEDPSKMEESGRLQSMGSLRVGHDSATSLSLFTFMSWRRKWQHTPVFLPGESQGRESLVGCHLWGRTESDTTEAT